MPRLQNVDDIVAVLHRRRRLLNMMDLALRGVCYGSLLTLIGAGTTTMAGATRQFPWSWWLPAIPLGGLCGLLAGSLVGIDPLRLARDLDRTAGSADRFASALQLAGHHRRQRVRLITADAVARVADVSPNQVIPLTYPKELKWLPLVLLLFVGISLIEPRAPLAAAAPIPEVSPDQWRQLQAELRREIERHFKESPIPEERQIAQQLELLADSLTKSLSKQQALAEIGRLRSKLDARRRELDAPQLNLRRASQALNSSDLLQALAALLEQGQYEEAAQELKRLAELAQRKDSAWTAEQLESMASDFQRLAEQTADHEELNQACRRCAAAAGARPPPVRGRRRLVQLATLGAATGPALSVPRAKRQGLDEKRRILPRLPGTGRTRTAIGEERNAEAMPGLPGKEFCEVFGLQGEQQLAGVRERRR